MKKRMQLTVKRMKILRIYEEKTREDRINLEKTWKKI